jgi:DNA-binding NtrC family response regulator
MPDRPQVQRFGNIASKKMRILVLDDNVDLLESMRLLLDSCGHEAVTSTDVREAIDIQSRRPADVLITDIFMPGTDGLEAIVAFRSRWPDLKIVAISGGGVVAKRDYLGVAAEIGANAMMRKPFDPQELLDTVDRFARGEG